MFPEGDKSDIAANQFDRMPLVQGAPAWVEAVVTMTLAVVWVGAFLAFEPISGEEAFVLVFAPVALPLLVVTLRKVGVGS